MNWSSNLQTALGATVRVAFLARAAQVIE